MSGPILSRKGTNARPFVREIGPHLDGIPTNAASVAATTSAIWEKALGPEHPHVATSLENYASLLRQTARAVEAARMVARAKAIRAKSE